MNHSHLCVSCGAAWSLTVCDGLLLGEVVHDGLAGRLGVGSGVVVLLQLLLRHQVRLQLPVQCYAYRQMGTNKKQQ